MHRERIFQEHRPCKRVHELKCWPAYYKDVALGIKPFEVRKDDRDFHTGDTLWLREFEPRGRNYTGESLHARVTYVLPGGEFGIEDGFVVLGIEISQGARYRAHRQLEARMRAAS